MATENDGANGAVDAEASVLLENGEPVAAIVNLREPGDEPTIIEGEILPPIEEASEGDISDVVAVAAIEAQAEVEIAGIRAEVQIAAIEAEAERERSWQEEAADLRENMRVLRESVETLLSGPPSIPQVSEAEAVEIMEEEILTPPSMSEPTSETQTEATPESADERPEAAAAPVRKRRRLI